MTDVAKEFTSQEIDERQKKDIDVITNAFITAATEVVEICPESREKSLAMTKLEEAKMWAVKAITHNK